MSNQSQINGVALVTGAADRIGATIARRLATAGFAVLVHYRQSEAPAQSVVAAITAAGGAARAVQADLADRAQRKTLIARAAEAFGPLTLLVNNASTFEPDSVADLDEALWDQHFAVHVEAPAFLARDFAAQLPDDTHGNIINLIDERVLHPAPAYFSYGLSKAALWDATRTMAQSLAPRIRVNAIGPGATLRPPRQSEESFQRSQSETLLGHGTTPDEIAEAVIFLTRSPSITGQMLAMDGGEHLEYKPRRAPTPRRPN